MWNKVYGLLHIITMQRASHRALTWVQNCPQPCMVERSVVTPQSMTYVLESGKTTEIPQGMFLHRAYKRNDMFKNCWKQNTLNSLVRVTIFCCTRQRTLGAEGQERRPSNANIHTGSVLDVVPVVVNYSLLSEPLSWCTLHWCQKWDGAKKTLVNCLQSYREEHW